MNLEQTNNQWSTTHLEKKNPIHQKMHEAMQNAHRDQLHLAENLIIRLRLSQLNLNTGIHLKTPSLIIITNKKIEASL